MNCMNVKCVHIKLHVLNNIKKLFELDKCSNCVSNQHNQQSYILVESDTTITFNFNNNPF